MLTANKGRSRLGASVAVKFSQEFATQVSWQKVDERTGAEIPDEDIIDGGGNEPTPHQVEMMIWKGNHMKHQIENREESIRILPDFMFSIAVSFLI